MENQVMENDKGGEPVRIIYYRRKRVNKKGEITYVQQRRKIYASTRQGRPPKQEVDMNSKLPYINAFIKHKFNARQAANETGISEYFMKKIVREHFNNQIIE